MRLFLGAIFMMMSIANTQAQTPPTSPPAAAPQLQIELNTILMNTTFQIIGPSAKVPNATSSGTGFIVGKPKAGATEFYFVLITAAHVLEDIAGDTVTIGTRLKQADGTYSLTPHTVQIRNGGKNKYVKHPNADVVALFVNLPEQYGPMPIVGDALLATDAMLSKYEIHPGDELLCLGFPLFASGPFGFPILRSGKIASYPLTPMKNNNAWLYDFRVFKGNSGGPVYFTDRNRSYGSSMALGETLQFVVGLVSEQLSSNALGVPTDLSLGVVVPAAFIKETIEMLPADPTP
jgi:hypothetical protein